VRHSVRGAGGSRQENADTGAVTVVGDLRRAFSSADRPGLFCSASQVLSPTAVIDAPPSWPRAVAVRLLGVASGAIGLAPYALNQQLVEWGREGGPLELPGSPMLTDRLTAAVEAPSRPLVMADGLISLFDPVSTGVSIAMRFAEAPDIFALAALGANERRLVTDQLCEASSRDSLLEAKAAAGEGLLTRSGGSWLWMLEAPDPIGHKRGVEIILRGPLGGPQSEAMWMLLLGPDVQLVGQAAGASPWTSLIGLPERGSRTSGRRTAALLALAAKMQAASQSVLVVDRAGDRSAAVSVATDLWKQHTSQFLLRPPAWPTLDESRRRLRVPNTALVGARSVGRLHDVVSSVLVTEPLVPSLQATAVRRMLDTVVKAQGRGSTNASDPYSAVVEPLGAHLTCELIAAASPAVVAIGESRDGARLLRQLIGDPSELHVDSQPRDIALYDAIVERLLDPSTVIKHRESVIRDATWRLLGADGELKDFQRAIVVDTLSGKDVLAVFRTGSGKSLCYQVPALGFGAADTLTIVISPLLALQRDQVDGLQGRGVFEATLYNSEQTPDIRRAIRRGISAGFYTTVFLAPEALWSPAIQNTLAGVEIGLIAIDEAHCISEMGHDFRPDYRTIPVALRRILGVTDESPFPSAGKRPVLLALTGTATPAVREDIVRALA
jgi:hypothetical protein